MTSQLQITPLGYKALDERKDSGAHYTPKILSDFVAAQIINEIEIKNINGLRILDPALGDGELILSLIREFNKKIQTKNIEIYGFDTDSDAIRIASERVKKEFPNIKFEFFNKDFLNFAIECGRNDLFSQEIEKFDIVIANPPYVRTQVLGAKDSQRIANLFNLAGRSDLYHAFLLGISMVLKPSGLAGVITSNRFMTTKSGGNVRSGLIKDFDILHVWDLGDTQLFEAAVLPSILLLKRKADTKTHRSSSFTSVYSTSPKSEFCTVGSIFDAINKAGTVKTYSGQYFDIQIGSLDHGESNDGVWRISTETSESKISKVKAKTYCCFGDIGKIRVGIKTTADKVFIRSDWANLPIDEQPELLFPLITHHVAARYKRANPPNPLYVLYPHVIRDGKRSTVNLADFPRTAKYLETKRDILEARDYVVSSGRKWFEIWVPQDPNGWKMPKLIFRDISEEPTFWIDLSGGIVNGDCYWMVCENPNQEDLLWLALAIGNSSFIEWYYDQLFNNKLYSGRRRFMTQYVEKFPIPNPHSDEGKEIIRLAKIAYNLNIHEELKVVEKDLDLLICKSFGLGIEEISR